MAETVRQREQFRWRRLAGGFEVLLAIQAAGCVVVIGGIQAVHAVAEHRAPDTHGSR
jgi:hypothetical protein